MPRLSVPKKCNWSPALIGLSLAVTLGSTQFVYAQTFNSGSNGSDGALNLTTPGIIEFDPKSFNPPLDADGDNIYHFTTINIGPGVIVRLTARKINGPVFWLATGAVQIDGTINLNGGDGHPTFPSNPILAARSPSVPGPGGYSGGVGQLRVGILSNAQPGTGPGGGDVNSGAGHATPGGGASGGPAYGNDFLVPLLGGSGGGGGTTNANNSLGGGSGAGGGALLIASSASITINGTISANGGNGGTAGFTSTIIEDGTGGSGGAIRLVAPSIIGAETGKINALGGDGRVRSGAAGRIRLEAFQQQFAGTTNPTRISASPKELFLPTNQPSVRVVSIDGKNVLSTPTGSFTVPDVAISKSTPVSVQIQARNIPLNATVTLLFFSENGPDISPSVSALSGTEAQSTATASVMLPSGFSRGFVRAKWTP